MNILRPAPTRRRFGNSFTHELSVFVYSRWQSLRNPKGAEHAPRRSPRSTRTVHIHPRPVCLYRGNSRGRPGGGGVSLSSRDSPVCESTSLIAPTLDNIAEVSTGMKITFELFVRVMSRRLSI